MRKELRSKVIGFFIVFAILISMVLQPAQSVHAASSYMTAESFIKLLVQSIDLQVNSSSANPYQDAAMTAGIIKEGDFNKYTAYITRTDAAILLNRADEYLHGDTVSTKLFNIVLEKRISDINKISEGKRVAVAKIVAKGIIKGYSNGYYIQNREFRGSKYISKSTANNLINLVLNPDKRARISPDGQLIRTTNLPKNAKNYDYILACYPNKFYERKFEFMFSEQYKAGERDPLHQIYPVDMKNSTFRTWNDEWAFSIEMDKYLYDWADKAETYLNYLFNVDYRTVDDEWIEGLASCYVKSNIDQAEAIRGYYIKHLKENKVIVESSIIAVEPSTLYDDGDYCMRAYVRYRIIANDINVKQNRLLRCSYPALDNLKSGVWREGIFDIRFGTNNGYQGDGAYWSIDILTNFVDEYNVPVK
jgi:hypothetical protein